jgi:predicted DNA binding CopG/RHH family protein
MTDKPALKTFPDFHSDKEAEEFVATADLAEYDFSQFRPMHFEFEEEAPEINMRVPQTLFEALKLKADGRGVPFSRYIQMLLEEDVARS